MKKWDVSDINSWDWTKHPIGGIIPEAGNSAQYKTGGWRSYRPIRDNEQCNDCLICFIYCPEAAIGGEKDQIGPINLDFCKGCGICAYECPKKAIKMVEETRVDGEPERSDSCDA